MEESNWSLENMKQTLSLLKKVMISEREERKKLKSELESISDVVAKAESDLKDKVKSR